MYYPAHIDGCSVVVLRQRRWGFDVLESGFLSFDGETLSLRGSESRRVFSDRELEGLLPVASNSRIAQCQGFQFFLLAEADE